MCCHMYQLLIIKNMFILILKLFKKFYFYVWMVLDGDMWCNKKNCHVAY